MQFGIWLNSARMKVLMQIYNVYILKSGSICMENIDVGGLGRHFDPAMLH